MEHYRLTNDIREQVLRALLAKYDKQQKSTKQEDRALGLAVYSRLLGGDARRARGLPEGWLPVTSRIVVKIGDRHYSVDIPEALPIPYSMYRFAHITLLATDPLARRIVRNDQEHQVQHEARCQLREQILGRLRAAYTARQLLEVWPEVEPFLPVTRGSTTPPASANKLNSELGLRPKKK